MQNNGFDDDDDGIWDDLDESDFEQCIIKETEFLTQNPSAQRKVNKNTFPTTEELSKHWIDGKSSSFNVSKSTPKLQAKNDANDKLLYKGKTAFKSSFPHSNSSSPTFKKHSFYKPLDIAASSSASSQRNLHQDGGNFGSTEEGLPDVIYLQSQLDTVLKEKSKVEEENFIKQGEVSNIRCELKRKDVAFEAERIDHCIALEAAEKRGKEKALKMQMDTALKLKILEKEVDKLQGNLLFKNREVDELLSRCNNFESQLSIVGTQGNVVNRKGSPVTKKRRLDSRGSPPQNTSNFANRFDFGDTKRSVKTAMTQTAVEVQPKLRTLIRVASSRGCFSGAQKVVGLLCSSTDAMDSSTHSSQTGTEENRLSLLAQLLGPKVNSSVASSEYQERLLKSALSLLDRLVQGMTAKDNSCSDRRSNCRNGEAGVERMELEQAIPLLTVLAVAHPVRDATNQESVRILALCLQAFRTANVQSSTEVLAVLESLIAVTQKCSNLSPDVCDVLIASFREFCKTPSDRMIFKLVTALLVLIKFESFKEKMCIRIRNDCLLRSICHLFHCTGKSIRPKEITNQMVAFVACLLHETDLLVTSRECACSSLLLSTFVGHLLRSVELLTEDVYWYPVINGVKVLHVWQCKDRAWWEKASQLNSYTALLSSVVRNSKYLKEKQILDQQTWDLIFDLYDVEESTAA